MFTSSRLDYGVNTFSPEGRLFQVEYALEAIKMGSTAMGIQTKDGVLLAVEKRMKNKLMVTSSNTKIFEVDSHIGCAYSGLQADGKTLINFARAQAQNYWFTYDEEMPVKSVTGTIANRMMSFAATEDDDDQRRKRMSRPFGVALIFAGCDPFLGVTRPKKKIRDDPDSEDEKEKEKDGKEDEPKGEPSLYVIDPSGTVVRYLAVAVGAGGESARSVLQDQYAKSMSLREAEDLCAEILKQVMEAKITNETIEMALVSSKTNRYELYSKDKLDEVIARMQADNIRGDDGDGDDE